MQKNTFKLIVLAVSVGLFLSAFVRAERIPPHVLELPEAVAGHDWRPITPNEINSAPLSRMSTPMSRIETPLDFSFEDFVCDLELDAQCIQNRMFGVSVQSGFLDVEKNTTNVFDFNARDSAGRTVLMHMVCQYDKAALQDLKTFFKIFGEKIDINARDNAGFTALHYAVAHNAVPYVKMLLEYGANSVIPTTQGRVVPLHIAAYNGYSQVARMLVERMIALGATKNLNTFSNKTPEMLAREQGHLVLAGIVMFTNQK